MTTKLAEKAAGNAMSRLTFKQSIKDRPKNSRYFRILLKDRSRSFIGDTLLFVTAFTSAGRLTTTPLHGHSEGLDLREFACRTART
jgi:hypothetical protein